MWENNFLEHKISESEFLTKPTAEGLRVTIKSTIEHSNIYLNVDIVMYQQTIWIKIN